MPDNWNNERAATDEDVSKRKPLMRQQRVSDDDNSNSYDSDNQNTTQTTTPLGEQRCAIPHINITNVTPNKEGNERAATGEGGSKKKPVMRQHRPSDDDNSNLSDSDNQIIRQTSLLSVPEEPTVKLLEGGISEARAQAIHRVADDN